MVHVRAVKQHHGFAHEAEVADWTVLVVPLKSLDPLFLPKLAEDQAFRLFSFSFPYHLLLKHASHVWHEGFQEVISGLDVLVYLFY